MDQYGPPSCHPPGRTFVPQVPAQLSRQCLFAQSISRLHLLVVEHTRDSEHGDWFHAEERQHFYDLHLTTGANPLAR